MNKKISTILASLLVYGTSVTFSQRPLPYVHEKKDYAADDVVGTWKWSCDSIVTVKSDGEVKAVWADGKRTEGRFEKISDNKYRFIWGNNESVEILKIKKEGNLLEGQNHAGSKVTATKISSITGIEGIQEGTSDQFLPNAKETLQTTQDYKKYIGQWKMSSWNGHYQLLEDGTCIINNGPSQLSKGIWFLAFDRLYLVWGMMSDTDVFKLNPDQSMKLQRIDNRSAANVTFEKLVSMNSPSIKESNNNLTIRRKMRVPVKPVGVEEVEPKDFEENFQGHSYKFIPVKKSWHLAKKDASRSGGYLVVITSSEENQFVNDLIIKANSGQHARTWIGLNNDNEKREWEWVNGEICKFFDWGPGEPNNSDSECSAHLGFRQDNPDWKGKWNNAPSDCMRYYVVECDNIKK